MRNEKNEKQETEMCARTRRMEEGGQRLDLEFRLQLVRDERHKWRHLESRLAMDVW